MAQEKSKCGSESKIKSPEGKYVKIEETILIQILQSLEGIKRKLHSALKA